MATKRTTTQNTPTALPGAHLPVPETRADRLLSAVLHPKGSRVSNDLASVVSVVAVRKATGDRVFTLGPSRTASTMPKWLDVDARSIAINAITPEYVEDAKAKPKLKIGANGALSIVESNLDWSGTYFAHHGPLRPEYELLEAFTLYDVEVYVQQAIRRRLSLMFRNGYRVTGNNQNKVKYINRRLNQIAYMMKKTWANFMREILTTLSLCSNCFLLKLRQEDASGGVANEKNHNRTPIAAYVMIPPHSLFPYLEKGKITKWRRYYSWSTKPWEDYKPEDIIHLTWDRKPSHIFGTPPLVPVRDDIYALRRLEENIELLFINFLFPLFHVKVGMKEAPAGHLPGGISEIDHTRKLIETMPKEGVLVTDERVAVDIVGSAAEALDPGFMLTHLKKRIFTGLGVSSIDMGEGDTSNASTADSVSQALKDSIKYYLDIFTGQISMEVFKDLFEEANFDLSVQESVQDVTLEFQEIDMDNKVKEENHATNLYNNNATTHDEFRQSIKRNPMSEDEQGQTHHAREVVGLAKVETENAIKLAKATPRTGVKPGGKKGKSGRKASTVKKATSKKKVSQNQSTPTNQHGTNNSPKKARSARTEISLYSNLHDAYEGAQFSDDMERWPSISARVIDRFFADTLEAPDQLSGSSYTKQSPNAEHAQLKDQVGQVTDLDTLFDLVRQVTPDTVPSAKADGDLHESNTSAERSEGQPRPEGALGSGDSRST